MYYSLPPSSSEFGRSQPILMYHQLAAPPKFRGQRGLCVAPGLFRRQMLELRETGFKTATLETLVGGENGPQITITFDDGFLNAATAALPVLAECGFSAIQFLVADRSTNRWDVDLGQPETRLMDDGQVREWIAAGNDIGAHTLTHPHLTRIPLAAARTEIFKSKSRLEDRFQRRIRHFCYPYGDFNPAVQELVIEAGFETACSTLSGPNDAGGNRYELRRWMVSHRLPFLAAWLPNQF